jgi:hypothetical protein
MRAKMRKPPLVGATASKSTKDGALKRRPGSTPSPGATQGRETGHKFHVTLFPNQNAKRLKRHEMTLEELGELIQTTSEPAKSRLPWLKLATFGNLRTEAHCLRHNANVLAISGLELDYDQEKLTLEQAIAIARRAQLRALFYTSASYSDEKPRWRIVLPTSRDLPPAERARLALRVNGVFDGVFSRESFTLSQAYYFGAVGRNPAHRAVVTQGDFIDQRADLDAGAMGKDGKEPTPEPTLERNWAEEYSDEGSNNPPPPGKIEAALVAIRKKAVDRAMWVDIGHGLKDHMGEDGLGLFKQFSSTWPDGDYDEAYTVKTWKGLKPNGDLTIGTVFHYADLASPGWWERALAATTAELGVFDAGDDTELPPPRGWLLGNTFCRKFMSSLLADGGIGKTSLRYAQLIALATGREITGEHVFQRCRVLLISLEDDRDELRRRVWAVLKQYNIPRSELKGWLFYCTPKADNGKLMVADKHGRPTRGGLADTIEDIVNQCGIDLVCLDPFVKTHAVEENDNSGMDQVVQILTDLSHKYDIGVDAPHHTSKGAADPGNANRGRGASAIKDAGRLIYTLSPMSESEAETFGVPVEDQRLFIRLDPGKVNILPPARKAKWFRLRGVDLDNGNELYLNGDNVQTVEPWMPPEAWDDMDNAIQKRILIAIDAGLPDGNQYTNKPNAGPREAWNVVVAHLPGKTQAQAKEIIESWVELGILEVTDYTNPVTRKEVKGLRFDRKRGPR